MQLQAVKYSAKNTIPQLMYHPWVQHVDKAFEALPLTINYSVHPASNPRLEQCLHHYSVLGNKKFENKDF